MSKEIWTRINVMEVDRCGSPRTDQSSLPEVELALSLRDPMDCTAAVQRECSRGRQEEAGFAGAQGVDLQSRAAINDR